MSLASLCALLLAIVPALANPNGGYREQRDERKADCTGINAISPQCRSNEVPYTRDFFYIGGQYVLYPVLKSDIVINQMYVEKLTPIGGAQQPYPVVLFTAGVPSGAAWLNTPDNRRGWASFFIEKKYQVYIVDQTGMGRSSQQNVTAWPLKVSTSVAITENDYTAPQLINPYPQSVNHTQWPGNGTQGDPYFDAFMASFLPITSNTTIQELTMQQDGCLLLSMIGPAFTISHSIGSTYPLLMSDACPDLLLGNINLEAGNIPFESYVGNSTVPAVGRTASRPWGLTNVPLNYQPPISSPSQLNTTTVGDDTPGNRSCILQQGSPLHTLPNVAKVPYVLFTGSASPHITYDHCIVSYLEQCGVAVDWIKLGDIGILGNAHFSYLESNNLQIAALAENVIQKLAHSHGHYR